MCLGCLHELKIEALFGKTNFNYTTFISISDIAGICTLLEVSCRRLVFSVGVGVPFLIMCVCYVRIVHTLRLSRERVSSRAQSSGLQQMTRNTSSISPQGSAADEPSNVGLNETRLALSPSMANLHRARYISVSLPKCKIN